MWPLVNLCPCHFECNSTTTTTTIPTTTTSLLIENITEYSSTPVSGKNNISTENSSEASIASSFATAPTTKSEKTTETSRSSSIATVQSITGMYSTVVLRCSQFLYYKDFFVN